MDIFTTQLTRVVPIPIKPENLKVKALLKEAANNKLSHDPDHLENHEYYFSNEEDQYHSSQQEKKDPQAHSEAKTKNTQQDNAEEITPQPSESNKLVNEKKDKSKHLDLYA